MNQTTHFPKLPQTRICGLLQTGGILYGPGKLVKIESFSR